MMQISGEWAVILGASGGTGGAVARSLAMSPGLDIFGVHRGKRPEQSLAVEEAVRATGHRCHMHVAPAGEAEQASTGADALLKVAGPKSVRVFVHAIAGAHYGTFANKHPMGRLEPWQFAKTFDAMAHSFVYWTQAMLDRDLLADGARIIALSNPMVDSVVHGWGLVAAAKAALEIYVRQMGHELGPRGHRVSMVKFGLVETLAIQRAFSDKEWERVKTAISGCTPARRLCTVEEVGEFLSVLAGPQGEWFNSGTIDMTGGQTGSLLDTIFNPSTETVS